MLTLNQNYEIRGPSIRGSAIRIGPYWTYSKYARGWVTVTSNSNQL